MKVIPPREGEVIGDAPDRRVEMLSDVDSLHATWSRFGPRRAGANLHIHYRHSDLFYVLAGELTVKLGPRRRRDVAPVGTLVHIPPLVVHGFRNGADAEVRYLNFHAPGRGLRRLHARPEQRLRPGRAAGGRRPPAVRARRSPAATRCCATPTRSPSRKRTGDDGAHVHREHAESLYVLEGELELTVDGEVIRAVEGTWLQVPAGVAHAVSASART